MTALLTLTGLCKRHGERALFDRCALTLDAAQAYVLTGVNGAGKSTLLRVLAGLEQAHIDRMTWCGVGVSLTPYPRALREAIVYVHQHPIMFSTSVEGNVGYGLAARGVSRANMQTTVDEAIAWAGVAHLRGTKAAHWSGGEKQRVALARARVLRPQLLLLDEPTSNLDGAAREQVIALIPALVAGGSSVVMACHDRDLIGLPGVKRLKLRDGQIEYR